MLSKSMIKAAARGRWETIFTALAPELRDAIERSPRHAAECPMPGHCARGEGHGHQKFRLPADFRETGRAICTCGAWGDGFALLMALHGWSFPQALERVASTLGMAEDTSVVSTDETACFSVKGKILSMGPREVRYRSKSFKVFSLRMQKEDSTFVELSGLLLKRACKLAGVEVGDRAIVDMTGIQTCQGNHGGTYRRKTFVVTRLPSDEEEQKERLEAQKRSQECRRRIEDLWASGVDVDSDSPEAETVRKYFTARGIDALPPAARKDLRAVRGLACKSADETIHKWDGLLGAVRDLDGHLKCVHRTFLGDGKKADVPAPKMLMRIGPTESIAGCAIHLGEPDDVLCVAEGIETAASVVIGTGYPCWSCVSAAGLKAVRIPEKVHFVFIFEDKDSTMTGQKAAAELRKRLQAEGRIAVVCSISNDIPQGMHGLDWNDILRLPDGINRFPVKKPEL